MRDETLLQQPLVVLLQRGHRGRQLCARGEAGEGRRTAALHARRRGPWWAQARKGRHAVPPQKGAYQRAAGPERRPAGAATARSWAPPPAAAPPARSPPTGELKRSRVPQERKRSAAQSRAATCHAERWLGRLARVGGAAAQQNDRPPPQLCRRSPFSKHTSSPRQGRCPAGSTPAPAACRDGTAPAAGGATDTAPGSCARAGPAPRTGCSR